MCRDTQSAARHGAARCRAGRVGHLIAEGRRHPQDVPAVFREGRGELGRHERHRHRPQHAHDDEPDHRVQRATELDQRLGELGSARHCEVEDGDERHDVDIALPLLRQQRRHLPGRDVTPGGIVEEGLVRSASFRRLSAPEREHGTWGRIQWPRRSAETC